MINHNLFFENIDHPVCLITKCKEAYECVDGYHIEFNSVFNQIFPEITKSNLFQSFLKEFEDYVLDSFRNTSLEKTIDITFNKQNYLLLKQALSSTEIAFLFKEKRKPNELSNIVLTNSFGDIGEVNFDFSTFEDAENIVIITDRVGRIEYVNKKFTEIAGYSSNEAIGNRTNILKSGKQSQAFYKQMWKSILKGQIWSNSFHNKKKSGQLYWQKTQIIPLRDKEGVINRFLALAEDSTEGKAIETIMEEKSDLLFQLIEGTPDVICVKDGEGRWLLANSSIKKLFGFEQVNYYGKTSLELAEYSSFYRTALVSCIKSDDEAWEAGELSRKDEVIPISNGDEIILDTLKIPSFNSDGSRKRMIVIGRDVSIRKKAIENLKQIEKRYAIAQRAGGIVSWEWDLEKLTLSWVDNLEEIFGDSSLFDNKGFRDVMEYIHPEDRFIFLRHMLFAIRNSDDYDFDIRVYDIHHNVKWVKFSGHIHYDELRAKSLLFGIIYDITERKNYVKDIIQAKKKAEESDHLKSTFLATMSHELRTPLNAVIGFSDLILGHTNIDPEVHEFVRLINNNGQNLLSLIEDIFDLSLIESNQVKISNVQFDLINLLNELAEVVPVEMRKLNKMNLLEFQNQLPNKQIVIDSDASRINQIISNLLKNAIKFTPKGYVKLGIREEEDDVVIFVEDNGIGISEEKQGIIFDIFRQGEESLTRQFGGAGLGLSLSNNLAELLGGKLWVESTEGKGSVFFFKIKKHTNGFKQTVNQNNLTVEKIDWSDKYVLIAEDEYSNYELLMYILKPTKIRIKQVTNGNDAIAEVLNNERPDIILMDIKMPELNGFEATKRIKEVYPELPIIAQTAFAISGDRELALSMGCDEYISKPIKKLDLIELMKKYLS